MESQLNLRMGTVAVVAATGTNQTSAGRGHSPRGAVLTPNESSMVNRVQGNTIKMGGCLVLHKNEKQNFSSIYLYFFI